MRERERTFFEQEKYAQNKRENDKLIVKDENKKSQNKGR